MERGEILMRRSREEYEHIRINLNPEEQNTKR